MGMRILQHHEAKNCGFIKELPIVSMACGMGRREAYLEDNEDLIRGKADARAPVREVQGAFWHTKVSENS